MVPAAIAYSLIVVVSFGIANAISKEIAEQFGAIRATVLRNALVVPIIAAAIVAMGAPIALDLGWIGTGVIIAFGGYLGFLFFMLALEHGKVGIVVPVASSSVVVSSSFGFLFLGDNLSSVKIAAVVLVTLGVMLASMDFRELRKSDVLSVRSGVPYALVCALAWGIAFPLYKFPSDHIGALFFGLIIEIVVLGSACLQMALTPETAKSGTFGSLVSGLSPRLIVSIAIASVGTALGTIFLNLAYQTGEVSIVAAICGASSIFALIAGAVVYGEVLSRQQYLGAILVAVGISLPSLLLLGN